MHSLIRALQGGQLALPGCLLGCRTTSEVPAGKALSDTLTSGICVQGLNHWCKAAELCLLCLCL